MIVGDNSQSGGPFLQQAEVSGALSANLGSDRDGEVVALMRNGLLEALLSDIDRNGTKATTLTVSLEGLLLRVDRYKTATFER